jgi:hypothetical protein
MKMLASLVAGEGFSASMMAPCWCILYKGGILFPHVEEGMGERKRR